MVNKKYLNYCIQVHNKIDELVRKMDERKLSVRLTENQMHTTIRGSPSEKQLDKESFKKDSPKQDIIEGRVHYIGTIEVEND